MSISMYRWLFLEKQFSGLTIGLIYIARGRALPYFPPRIKFRETVKLGGCIVLEGWTPQKAAVARPLQGF